MKFDPALVDEIREICLVEFAGTAAVKILKLLAKQDIEDIVEDVQKLVNQEPSFVSLPAIRNLVNMIRLSFLGLVEE